MNSKLNFTQLKKKLPPRKKTAHKGDFGHALIVGGTPGFEGAPRLAAEACLYTGAGLVSVATHPEHAKFLNIGRPELMCHAVDHEKTLQALIEKASVILIGPGLGQDAWGRMCWNTVLKTDKPLVLDADALNLLAQQPRRNSNWVLTPHPAEAARLSILKTTEEIQSSREKSLKALCKDYEGVVVLKGANTLIGKNQKVFLNAWVNPAMATAGMGDVLSGIITGLLAQKLESLDAACLGVALHSAAAKKLLQKNKLRVILAGQIAPMIPTLLG